MSEVIKEPKDKVWAPPVFTVGGAGGMQKKCSLRTVFSCRLKLINGVAGSGSHDE